MFMFQQIVIHTPLWVWVLLAFLVYRGWSAVHDRELAIAKVAVIPLLMLALSLHGLYGQARTEALALGLAVVTALVSGTLSWIAAGRAGAVPHPGRGTVFLRGSWFPLLLMIAIFGVKYTAGVLHAMHSGYVQGPMFAAAISAVYGVFIGVSMGRMLRILHLYRQAQAPAAQLTV